MALLRRNYEGNAMGVETFLNNHILVGCGVRVDLILILTPTQRKVPTICALWQWLWYELNNNDNSLTMSHIELTLMLDSLSSTLSTKKINSFFTRCFKNPHMDELMFPEAIQHFEMEIHRLNLEKNLLNKACLTMRAAAACTSVIREQNQGRMSACHNPQICPCLECIPRLWNYLAFSCPHQTPAWATWTRRSKK